ncbi:hypothetical protein STEG23_022147, partial [Scotinomys teguina]
MTDKLTPIHDHIFCCRSGSAADTQAAADAVTYQFGFHSMELNEPPLVHTAASLFKEMCYRYREDLMAGIIIAGWDPQEGGQVYSVPMGGMMVRQSFAIGGSGSSYIYGYIDATYREGMTKNECLQFTANALALAMERDGSSGGVIRLAAIQESGVERQVATRSVAYRSRSDLDRVPSHRALLHMNNRARHFYQPHMSLYIMMKRKEASVIAFTSQNLGASDGRRPLPTSPLSANAAHWTSLNHPLCSVSYCCKHLSEDLWYQAPTMEASIKMMEWILPLDQRPPEPEDPAAYLTHQPQNRGET